MAIEVGKVAIVKTTGEKVFVLAAIPATGEFSHLGGAYKVRVPKATKDGIEHVVSEFLELEMYTPEEALEAEFKDFQSVEDKKLGMIRNRQERLAGQPQAAPLVKVN